MFHCSHLYPGGGPRPRRGRDNYKQIISIEIPIRADAVKADIWNDDLSDKTKYCYSRENTGSLDISTGLFSFNF